MAYIKLPPSGTASAFGGFALNSGTYGRVLFSDSNNEDHLTVIKYDGTLIDLEGSNEAFVVATLNEIGDVNLTSNAQGDILYRNGTEWVNLSASDAGKVLTTNGIGSNLTWDLNTVPDGNGIFDINNNGSTVSSNFIVNLTDSIDINNSTLFINNNVGIGTDTPTHLLTVGTSSNGGEISIAGDTSGSVLIKPNVITNDWTMTLPENSGNISQFVFDNFGGEMLLNDGNGNLYFGASPSISIPEGEILIGNTYSYAERRSLSGDIVTDYVGSVTIQPNVVSYDKMQVVSSNSFLGSTNITGGPITEIPILDAFISASSSNATNLENNGNWTGFNYTGTAIVGTFQGQQHYDTTKYFLAIADDLWIRMARV